MSYMHRLSKSLAYFNQGVDPKFSRTVTFLQIFKTPAAVDINFHYMMTLPKGLKNRFCLKVYKNAVTTVTST